MEHGGNTTAPSEKYYFLVRRLHSLAGLIPIGVFLVLHLTTNVTILAPGEPGEGFQESVERIHALGPLLVPVEIVGILIPLLFHSLLGFKIWLMAEPNALQYRYGSNLRFTLQRWTGGIAFFYILFHVWQMHWVGAPFGGGNFAVHDEAGNPASAVSTARAIQSAWWIAPIYAVGIIAAVYHLSNGIWTSLITWGITIRPRTQQVAGYICAAFGVVLGLVGLGALSGFRTYEVADHAAGSPDALPVATVPNNP